MLYEVITENLPWLVQAAQNLDDASLARLVEMPHFAAVLVADAGFDHLVVRP